MSALIKTAQRHSHENGSSPLTSIATLVNAARAESTITHHDEGPTLDQDTPAIAPPKLSPENGDRARFLPGSYFRTIATAIADVAEALHHAHLAEIIHRDLKPSNIMIEPSGHAWVLDFGLARFKPALPEAVPANGDAGDCQDVPSVESEAKAPVYPNPVPSLTRGILGTLPYMAPEQIRKTDPPDAVTMEIHDQDPKVDARTDVWGLGATLYELLTLERAFSSRDQILTSDPARPSDLIPNVPRDLEAVCLKALSKEPARRYATAQDFADDLRRWLGREPVKARPAQTLRRVALWCSRNKGWAAAIIAAGIAVLSLGLGSVALGERAAAVANARAQTLEVERDAANDRDRVHQRELLVQDIQRIRMSTHRNGWRKTIENNLVGTAQLGADDDFLRTQAVASLRELDAVEEKALTYAASNLAFDPQGRRLFSSWERDRAIRVWDRETDQQHMLKIKGDGPFAFRADGTPLQLSTLGDDERTLVLQELTHETVVRRFTSPDKNRPFLSAGAITRNGSHIAALCRTSDDDPSSVTAQTGPPGVAAVWAADSGKLLCTIALSTPAFALTLSPDAKLLATGDVHGTVNLWDLRTGKPVATVSASDNLIQCLTFGREPRRSYRQVTEAIPWQLAVGDVGGTVIMLDLIGKRIRSFGRGSSNDIKALDFNPDGTMLASTGRNYARVWDVSIGRLVLEIEAGNYMPALAFSPVGNRIAVGRWGIFNTTDGVKVYELREGPGMRILQGMAAKIEKKAFSPDGRLFAALADDWQVGVWETSTGQLQYLFRVPPGVFTDNACLAFDSTSRLLAVSAYEHATLWDTQAGRLLRTWDLPPGFDGGIAFHGPERLMLFRTETQDRVPPSSSSPPDHHPRVYRLYNLLGAKPGAPVAEFADHDAGCFGVAMPADGRFIVADGINRKDGRKGRMLIAYDMMSGKVLWSMPAGRPSESEFFVRVDPTGSLIVLNFLPEHRCTWLTLPDRKWLADVEACFLSLGPNGDRYFSVPQEPKIAKYEFHYHPQGRTGPEIAFLQDRETQGTFVFAPDGSHVAWAASDHSVTICDLVEVQREMAKHGLGW